MLSTYDLQESENIESIITADKLQAIFAVTSDRSYSQDQKKTNRLLVRFDFNTTNISKSTQNISVSQLGLNSSETLNIMLLVIEDRVLITDGVKLVSVNAKDFSQHQEVPVDLKGAQKHNYEYASQN